MHANEYSLILRGCEIRRIVELTGKSDINRLRFDSDILYSSRLFLTKKKGKERIQARTETELKNTNMWMTELRIQSMLDEDVPAFADSAIDAMVSGLVGPGVKRIRSIKCPDNIDIIWPHGVRARMETHLDGAKKVRISGGGVL